MSTPSDASGPQPPPPSGYEATLPLPAERATTSAAPSSYLAETYPAAGFPPAPPPGAVAPPVPPHQLPPPGYGPGYGYGSGFEYARPDGPTTTAYPSPYGQPYVPAPGAPYGGPPPGAYGPQPYGATPYGSAQPYGYPAWDQGWQAPRTDTYCIWALVTGLVGLFGLWIVGPVGVWFGIVGLRRTTRDGTEGRGLAIGGIVTGAITTLMLLGFGAFFLFMLANPEYA